MTIDDFIKIGEIRSKMTGYQEKKANCIALCSSLLSDYKSPYASLSGGKDSVAMCYLLNDAAEKCGRDFRIWSHISDASFPGTREICLKVAEDLGRKIDISESEKSAFEYLDGDQKKAFGKSGVFFDEIREYAKDKDLSFVGVRAYESKRRMKAARTHGEVFRSETTGGVTVCNPLQWFRLEDVAAVLYEYNAPIHPIYYKMSVDSFRNSNGEEQFIRLSYITSRDLLNKGTAVFLRVNYPEQFNKLASVYPEIRYWV